MEEIHKWRDLDPYEEVPDTGQPRISCCWVCTEKMKGGQLTLKARLCVRGCEELNDPAKTDSPTCQKESLRVLMCILAAKRWTLNSMVIKSAYLPGIPINKELYMVPPKEADTKNLWKLKKCVYGLSDAGCHWHLKVVQELKALGASQLKLDIAVFAWHDPNGVCCGIMATHVDDFVYGGTVELINSVIPQLRSIIQVSSEESDGMKYVCLSIRQNARSISFSTDAYCFSLGEISDLGPDRHRPLSEQEVKLLRHLSGQLNWIATQSRPDIWYENCMVGNCISKAMVRDIAPANKAVRKTKPRKSSAKL